MKHLFAFALMLLTLVGGNAFSQCVPDPGHTTEFLFPLPTAPLPSGTVGTAYAQVITINVPMDTAIDLTTVIGFPFPAVQVTVNSLTVGSVAGLPIGLFANTNPGTGIINGGASGCIDITGTPTTSGQYAINVPLTLNVQIPGNVPVIGGTAQNIPVPTPYNMEVVALIGVDPSTDNGFTVGQSLPNPTSGATVIRYAVTAVSDVKLEVLDVTGKLVYAATQTAVTGEQIFRFNASTFAPGMYLYRITDGSNSVARKMVVR